MVRVLVPVQTNYQFFLCFCVPFQLGLIPVTIHYCFILISCTNNNFNIYNFTSRSFEFYKCVDPFPEHSIDIKFSFISGDAFVCWSNRNHNFFSTLKVLFVCTNCLSRCKGATTIFHA